MSDMKERYCMTMEEIRNICYPIQEMCHDTCGEDSFYCPDCPVWIKHLESLKKDGE